MAATPSTTTAASVAEPSRASGARQGSVRRHNLGLVLAQVRAGASAVSRADIAATTGLTRATVSALVDTLLEAGLVAEDAPPTPRGAGRPAVPLRPARGAVVAIGVEVNVGYVALRALDLAGEVMDEDVETADLRGSDPAQTLARVRERALQVVAERRHDGSRVAGVAVALPGIVDLSAQLVRVAPNLGWRDVALGPALAAPVDEVPVSFANEADLAARAEIGSRTSATDFLYLSGEVGIGGAIVQDGLVVHGNRGGAGEIGHMTVEPDGPPCTCGSRGCLERYAGTEAILQAAHLDPATSAAVLAKTAADGDRAAGAALARAGWALGIATANVANLLPLDRVVLGGSLGRLAGHLQAPMEQELRRRVLRATWAPTAVEVATGGAYPAVTGAALAVLDRVVADPLPWLAA